MRDPSVVVANTRNRTRAYRREHENYIFVGVHFREFHFARNIYKISRNNTKLTNKDKHERTLDGIFRPPPSCGF